MCLATAAPRYYKSSNHGQSRRQCALRGGIAEWLAEPGHVDEVVGSNPGGAKVMRIDGVCKYL